jgi:GNAT superfamily N-acetyltransferase
VKLTFSQATEAHAPELFALRALVSAQLDFQYGEGYWSTNPTLAGVTRGIGQGYVLAGFQDNRIVATLTLLTKKPWAIDASLFTPVKRPLYLVDMAVLPGYQRKGVGRAMLKEASRIAAEWPANAIWLDAYDALAGAGGFYASCGFSEVGHKEYKGTPLVYFEKPVLPTSTK